MTISLGDSRPQGPRPDLFRSGPLSSRASTSVPSGELKRRDGNSYARSSILRRRLGTSDAEHDAGTVRHCLTLGHRSALPHAVGTVRHCLTLRALANAGRLLDPHPALAQLRLVRRLRLDPGRRHRVLTFVVAAKGTIERERAGRILLLLIAAGVFWIAGGLANDAARVRLWIVALAIDYSAPLVLFRVPGRRRLAGATWDLAERTAWRICRDNRWWSVFGEKRGRNGRRSGRPVQDDPVQRSFTADAPNCLRLRDIFGNHTGKGTAV